MLSSAKIGDKAALVLNDVDGVSWTVTELAKWINAACRELVRLKPTALTASVAMLLAAGTRQSLAGASFVKTADGSAASLTALQLLAVERNMGSAGTQPGAAVTATEREKLDVLLPGWHQLAAGQEISRFMFDPKDPLAFWNYPPAPASPALYVQVLVSRAPVNVLDDADTVLGTDDIDPDLADIYEDVLVDGVLALALAKDAGLPGAAQRQALHAGRFASALGVKLQNEVQLSPRRAKQSEGQ